MSKGFTLIELVCTLLILNILVVSAIPKLNSVKTDAVVATLMNLKGSVKIRKFFSLCQGYAEWQQY